MAGLLFLPFLVSGKTHYTAFSNISNMLICICYFDGQMSIWNYSWQVEVEVGKFKDVLENIYMKVYLYLSHMIGVLFGCFAVCRPGLIDIGLVFRQSNQENLEKAFSVAERELGVTRLLDPEGERRHTFSIAYCISRTTD